MKRILLSIIVLFGITTIASAQTTKNNNASKAKTVTGREAKKHPTNVSADTVTLTNRKIYHWSDGQRATPTGEEATSSNGSGYATLKKDTAKVVGERKQ